ncbi:MAG TPA: Ig-like domain-containing protein [Candidatus Saccharimonadales bacterium]|nr:Ig-like domain-containing protein [Candidatus Saccharimonadales bacterium]
MKLNPLRVIATFLFFLTVATQTTSTAQTVPDPCVEIAQYKDFITLADRRAELLAESQRLTFEISALENELLDAGTQAEVDALKKRLDDLQNKPNKTEFDEQSIQTYETLIRKTGIDTVISAKLAEKNEVLAKDKVLLQCIQSKISQLTSPEQNFRTSTSWIFAALIGAVIIGFFVLAFRDEVMRRAIFSGETGIQFLTLFSVVIAIILFGIINILEGKELAALLGGLSGYILGRTSQRVAPPAPPAKPTGAATLQKFIKDLTSISVSPSSATLSSTSIAHQLVAEPKDIKGAVIRDDDKLFVPEWESSDPAVAKVDQSGLVSMVGPGTANITASYGNIKSNPCEVTCT